MHSDTHQVWQRETTKIGHDMLTTEPHDHLHNWLCTVESRHYRLIAVWLWTDIRHLSCMLMTASLPSSTTFQPLLVLHQLSKLCIPSLNHTQLFTTDRAASSLHVTRHYTISCVKTWRSSPCLCPSSRPRIGGHITQHYTISHVKTWQSSPCLALPLSLLTSEDWRSYNTTLHNQPREDLTL